MMFLLAVTLFNVVATLYAKPTNQSGKIADELSSRVWYGEKAYIFDYPYFATLPRLCGAAIISESWLVTAAHCLDDLRSHLVLVGGDSITTTDFYLIDDAIAHPEYSSDPFSVNDIALLHLLRPLTFSETVQPLHLPLMEYEFNVVHKFAGRGLDQTNKPSPYLMSIDVRTLEEEECLRSLSFLNQSQYSSFKYYFTGHIKDVTICTERFEDIAGVCFGDSGSPLVRDNTLVGVASWIPTADCSENRVFMFTNVAPFVEWIQEVTGVGFESEDYPLYS